MSNDASGPAEKLGSGLPRMIEAPLAAVGLVVALPALILGALAIRLSSRGPVLFRQHRIGRRGRPFELYKLRTMRFRETGPGVTAGDDPRITAVGRLLRRAKIDELPELWNVLRGEMALVGPRPEVPEYVNPEDPLWKAVLEARPGLTDPMTIRLRNEEALLQGIGTERERFYREILQPLKLRGYRDYLRTRTWGSDIGVLFRTALAILHPARTTDSAFSADLSERTRDLAKRPDLP